jgi:hypothetical protein
VSIPGADGTGGGAGIITLTDNADSHPAAFVTAKLKIPGVSPDITALVPVPVVFTVPGYRIRVHVPCDGKLTIVTLPVRVVHAGAVMVPGSGGAGDIGCSFITAGPDAEEEQPDETETLKVYVPALSISKAAVVPVPAKVIPVGFAVISQADDDGNPLN